MNLRWLLFDYADPALPFSFWKRQKLIWRPIPIWKMPQSLRRGRIVTSIVMILPIASIPFLFPYLTPLFGSTSIWGEFFLTIIPFLVISWIWSCMIYGLYSLPEHYYRIKLEGFDVCLGCGYWLRGLDETSKACPECGNMREPMPNISKE